MKSIYLISFFWIAAIGANSQCPIPYGKKTFTKVEYFTLVKNEKTGKLDKKLERSSNTSLTLEISKNSRGEQGDYFVLSGVWLSGNTSVEYIREWNCSDVPSTSNKQYSFRIGDPAKNKYTWYLVISWDIKFIKAFLSVDDSLIVFSE